MGTLHLLPTLRADRALIGAPSGAKAVTYDRLANPGVGTNAIPAAGTTLVSLLPCTKSGLVSTVKFRTGSTAGAGTAGNVHQWAAILDSTGVVLAVTTDQTLTAMAASTEFSWNLSAALGLAPNQLYYVELCISMNTTQPTLSGIANNAGSGIAPIISGAGASGQTTPPAVGAQRTLPASASFLPLAWAA